MSASVKATTKRTTNGTRTEVVKPPPTMPYYCPTSPNKEQQYTHHRRVIVDDEAIDPQLRSMGATPSSSSAPGAGPAVSMNPAGISTTLVPAHFPSADDDPHGEDDLEDTSSMRTPRARRTRRANGAGGAEGGAGARRPRRRSFDDSENPFALPAEAQDQRADGRPVFNRELYPGYDEYGNRRGLEHLRGGAPPSSAGSYYRPRVHHYDSSGMRTAGAGGPGQLVVPPAVDYANIHHQNALYAGINGGEGGAMNPALLVPAPGPGPTFPSGREKTIHEILGLEPGTPISLDSLTDPEPGQKPEYTYATLVKLAIYASPQKKLTLQEIYEAIEKRFSWFKECENPNAWKTSIRHSLSLLAAFQKVPRHVTDPGKGHYWTVDFSKGEGNKRIRKRNKKPPKRSANDATKKRDEAEARANGQRHSNSATRDTSQSAQEDPDTDLEMSDSDDCIDPKLTQPSMMRTMGSGSGSRGTFGSGLSRSMNSIPMHSPNAISHANTSLSASLRMSARAAGRREPYPRPPSTASTTSSVGNTDHLRYYRRAPVRDLDEDYDNELGYDHDDDRTSVGSTSLDSVSVGSASTGMDMDMDFEEGMGMGMGMGMGRGRGGDAGMSVTSSGLSSRSASTPPTSGPNASPTTPDALSHSGDGPIPIPGRRFGRPILGGSGSLNYYGLGHSAASQTAKSLSSDSRPRQSHATAAAAAARNSSNSSGFGSVSASVAANGRTTRSSSLSLSTAGSTAPTPTSTSASTPASTPASASAPGSGFLSHASRVVSFTSAAAAAAGGGGARAPVFGKRDRDREDIVMIDAGGLPAARRVSPRKRAAGNVN